MERVFRMKGPHVYLWPIHTDVWQKPSQFCKVIILQLKLINNFFKIPPGTKSKDKQQLEEMTTHITQGLVLLFFLKKLLYINMKKLINRKISEQRI